MSKEKYQVVSFKRLQEIPQGWSRNIIGTERHYRLGNYLISYSNLLKRVLFFDLSTGESFYIDRKRQIVGDVDKYKTLRQRFLVEIRKKNSKLGALL